MSVLLTGIIIGATLALWYFLKTLHSHFGRRGVHHLPTSPVVGNMMRVLLKKDHVTTHQVNQYMAFAGDKFYGTYEFLKPVLVVRDPELLRKILVNDFDHFTVRRDFGVGADDPFLSKSLVALKGQRWRDMRSTLSPVFTGSKLRDMLPLMQECCQNLLDNLRQELKTSGDGFLDIDAKELCSRYATDVIATCAFGLKVDSLEEKDNEFYKAGKELTSISIFSVLIAMASNIVPFYKKKSSRPAPPIAFLRKVIYDTMRNRQENNITRADMIQLLIEAKKAWTDEDLFAQTLVFYFAGFDTVSSALTFVLHELAMNPQVQETLQQEVDDAWKENQGLLEYDQLNQLKYLDMVISETLRKWPPSISGFRTCTKQYNLGKPFEGASRDYIINPGELVAIPTWAIHHDHALHPKPHKFDPGRFSDENRCNIKPFSYMPFGMGPRNCIGSRFALTELKAMVYELVHQVEVLPGPRTARSCQVDRGRFRTTLEDGHWLRLELRQK